MPNKTYNSYRQTWQSYTQQSAKMGETFVEILLPIKYNLMYFISHYANVNKIEYREVRILFSIY